MRSTHIDLLQRGHPHAIGRIDYDERWRDPLRVLASHRILTIADRGDYVLVAPNQYVGFARTSGGELKIAPRFPGLLRELRAAFPLDARAVTGGGYDPASTEQRADRVVRVMAAIERVLEHGVPFEYARSRSSGVLRGRIHVGETIQRFSSRGVYHQAVSSRSVRNPSVGLLRLVRTALDFMRSESMVGIREISHVATIESALSLKDNAPLGPSEALDLCASLIANAERADVAQLARAIEALISTEQTTDDVAGAYGDVLFNFTDVDSLWERAVRAALASLGVDAQLHPLRGRATPFIARGGPDIDPDVVVWADGRPVLVVDAKDSAATSPNASDVYQVSAYARQLATPVAMLVYLSSGGAWEHRFGDEDLTIWSLGVPVHGEMKLESIQDLCRPAIDQVMSLRRTDGE